MQKYNLFDFAISRNNFLSKNMKAFYHLDYIGNLGADCDNLDKNPAGFIYTLKEDFWKPNNPDKLKTAAEICYDYIYDFLSHIDLPRWSFKHPYYVCLVPRSKAHFYTNNERMLFRDIVRCCVNNLNNPRIKDGTDFFIRVKDVRMTHVRNDSGWNNGDRPYPGITMNTCKISPNIKGKNIILIDDIYTQNANVIEDCVETLIKFGAMDIGIYVVAKTRYNHNYDSIINEF